MRVVLLSFFSLFLLQCSTTPQDPEVSYLEKVQGTWKLTEKGSTGLNTILDGVDGATETSEGDVVTIASDGNFTAGGIYFTFVEIESTGILAIYSFPYSSDSTKYIGIGFNAEDNLLLASTSPSDSTDITPPTNGTLFLIR